MVTEISVKIVTLDTKIFYIFGTVHHKFILL